MTILYPVVGLITSGIIVGIMGKTRIRFGVIWLTAFITIGAVWAWSLVMAWQLPQYVELQMWADRAGLFGGPDWLVIDSVSWPIAFSLLTIGFSAVLTSLMRSPLVTPGNLAGILALTGLGIAAVTAGTVTSLLLAWTAIDLYELFIRLSSTSDRQISERIVISSAGSVAGTLFVLLAVGSARQNSFDLIELPQAINLIIVIAAGFRLGVLPVQPPIVPRLIQKQGLQTLLQLAPVAGAISLLARAAKFGLPEIWQTPILLIVLMAGLYGSVNWLSSLDEPGGRPFWILGAASLAVAAVVFRHQEAVIAIGVVLIAGGGTLFLRDVAGSRLLWLNAFAALLMTGIVISPSMSFGDLIAQNFLPWGIFLILIQCILIIGFLKHSVMRTKVEREYIVGLYIVYIGGLVLSVVSMVFIGLAPMLEAQFSISTLWPGLLVIAIVAAVLRFNRQITGFAGKVDTRLIAFISYFSPMLIYRFLWRLYRLLGRGVSFVSRVLEGRSAVLWAILLLAFLTALFSQFGVGT